MYWKLIVAKNKEVFRYFIHGIYRTRSINFVTSRNLGLNYLSINSLRVYNPLLYLYTQQCSPLSVFIFVITSLNVDPIHQIISFIFGKLRQFPYYISVFQSDQLRHYSCSGKEFETN